VRIRDAVPADLTVVASWITTRRECALWAGPGVPFPLELPALATQIGMAGAIDVALEDAQGLAAFGQAHPRPPGRAHLARVVVRPDARGRGAGRALVEALLCRAAAAGLSVVTLNVYRENRAAVALYTALGFVRAERPPGDSTLPDNWFMQRGLGSPTVGPSAR
jgi:ribosomal protein S18 acetylase RimI-like enzyme